MRIALWVLAVACVSTSAGAQSIPDLEGYLSRTGV